MGLLHTVPHQISADPKILNRNGWHSRLHALITRLFSVFCRMRCVAVGWLQERVIIGEHRGLCRQLMSILSNPRHRHHQNTTRTRPNGTPKRQ